MKVAYGCFAHVHRQHWSIEGYHRAIKQPCHAPAVLRALEEGHWQSCLLRLTGLLKLEERRARGLIASWYELKRRLIDHAVGDFIHQMAGQHSA